MVVRNVRFLSLVGTLAAACTWTSDGGFAPRHESGFAPAVTSEPGSFQGEPISISTRGRVTIVGVEGRDSISVRARFHAGARDIADAEAAFADAAAELSVENTDGLWRIDCPGAAEDHGSAVASGTGCAEMIIEVPTGSDAQPLVINGSTHAGGIHVSNVVVEGLSLQSSFGLVADVTPVDGAAIELVGRDLVSGMCSTWLRVPEDTAFEDLSLSVSSASYRDANDIPADSTYWLEVDIRGFDDAPDIPRRTGEYTWSREASGARVETARLVADIGKAILTTDAVPDADELSLCEYLELG